MYRKRWDGAAWSKWEPLGGTWASAPAAVASGPNRIETLVAGTDGALYHRRWGA